MSTVVLGIRFVTETCYREDCRIAFAMPAEYQAARLEDHGNFFCPRGHSQHYTGESDTDRLKRQVEAEKASARWYRDRADAARIDAARAEASRRVTKGHLTRLRKRVKSGVCPCCGRTFQALARHMATQHPDYQAGE